MKGLWKASTIVVILAIIVNVAYQCIYGFTPKRIFLLVGMIVYVALVRIIAKFEADSDDTEE